MRVRALLSLNMVVIGTLFCANDSVAGSSEIGTRVATEKPITVAALRTEYRRNPLGIDTRIPRLSWQIRSATRGMMQSAYQIRVAMNERDLAAGRNLIWDSGKVMTDQSILLPYGGPAVESRQRYHWHVGVWDSDGAASNWSQPAYWEMGLLLPEDWQADWIEPSLKEDPSKANPSPMLRKTFRLNGNVRSARVYVTSHGLYEIYVNGQRVGDQLFTPGWTSFSKRLQYQTYDVTSLLVSGDNAVGVILGDGWYRGPVGFYDAANHYGERLALLLQLHVAYEDGREEVIVTDSSWKSSTGPILMSQIYAGEIYDARLEKVGWSTNGYDNRNWSEVKAVSAPKDILVASAGMSVRRIGERKPVKIFRTPEGDSVADIGQNMVGWVRLKVEGPAGTIVRLRHAEVLDQDGNFYTENLGTAQQEVRYILKGAGLEVYEPHFTFQGFRYVAVEGYPGEIAPDRLTGIVIHSDLPVTGEFATSNPLINQLQGNIVWSHKGNFLDVPMDCPQRNERLGWTGDAQVFFPTAAFNMNVAGFFTKWLADLQADQYQNGAVPFVVPDVVRVFEGRPAAGAAGWGDAATVIPWNMYLAYGDTRILATQYESMVNWVAYEQARAGDDYLWDGDFQFGDWMDFGADTRNSFGATDTTLIATAYFAHSADVLAKTAEILERFDDAVHYRDLHSRITAAFQDRFVSGDGRVGMETQTAYALALEFGLLAPELRPLAAKRLAQIVRRQGHVTTGFLGTAHLLHALSRHGYLMEAYLLLNRTEFPSWLYPIKRGATTIWERWDGIKPDGSFGHSTENSFNHFAYGAVGDWMYRVMAGINIDPAVPAYKHILIQPLPGGGFTLVKASLETLYGRLASAWEWKDGRFTLTVEVPPNTRATVRLPRAAPHSTVLESDKPLADVTDIRTYRQEGDTVLVDIGSGRYQFTYPMTDRP